MDQIIKKRLEKDCDKQSFFIALLVSSCPCRMILSLRPYTYG